MIRSFFFKPVSFLWEFVYQVRRFCYSYGIFSSETFKVPIISVGNIAFGGAGKTPFTIWLANYLAKSNLSSLILSRGYKGKFEKSSGLLMSGDRFRLNPIEYGDEPTMMARKMNKGAVVVGAKRARNLKYYFHKVLPDVVLLDDGFQHIQLERDMNIVLFDALMPLNAYQVAPMGYLREGFSSLREADSIVITRADQISEQQMEELEGMIKKHTLSTTPISYVRYVSDGLYDCQFNHIHNIDEMKGMKVITLVAIASPNSFYNLLNEYGIEIVEKYVFPDHYFFTAEDVQKALVRAAQLGAYVVTTEKDMVKVRRMSLDKRFLYLNIDIDFLKGKEELLRVLPC